MANEQNLKPFTSEQSREQAKKNGRKGGKASAKAKMERKATKDQMIMLLSLPLVDETVKKKFEKLGIGTDDMNNQMAMLVALYQRALKGDTGAINAIREIIGERIQEIKINTNIDEKVQELNQLLDKM